MGGCEHQNNFAILLCSPPTGPTHPGHFSPSRLWGPLDRTQIWEPFLHHFLRFSWNRPLQFNHLRKKLHHGFSSALIVAHPSYLSDPDPNLFADP